MSVINSMLRDLEQRREQGEAPQSDEQGALTNGVVVTRTTRGFPFGTLIKVLVILLLGLLLWFVASNPLVQEGGFQLLQRLTSQSPEGDGGSSVQLAENGGGGSGAVILQREPAPELVEQRRPAPADSDRAAPAPPAAEAPPAAAASETSEPEPAPPVATSPVEPRPVILLHDLIPIEIPVPPPEPVPPTRIVEKEKTLSPPPVEVTTSQVVVEEVEPAPERAALQKVEVSSTPQELAGQAYGEAVHALRGGDRAKAEEMLRRSLEHQPQHIGSLEALSALMLSMGRYQEAEVLVDRGLALVSNHGLLLQLKARLLMHGGETERAVALLEQHLPAVGVSPETHALLAALYQKRRQYQQAAKRYEGLLRIDPSNGVWEMGYAIALESMGQRGDAYRHYEKALNSGRLKSAALTFVEGKVRELTAIGGQQ